MYVRCVVIVYLNLKSVLRERCAGDTLPHTSSKCFEQANPFHADVINGAINRQAWKISASQSIEVSTNVKTSYRNNIKLRVADKVFALCSPCPGGKKNNK